MNGRTHLLGWRTLAAWAGVALLLAMAVHPATATVAIAAAVVLMPVALFGSVLVPLSLGSAEVPEPRVGRPILLRARLFQRPPPVSLQ
ncbi:MAG: hypothetical protein WB622_06245 [Acidobacteriaceae bacterium]